MRTKKVYWFGLVFVMSIIVVACSGTTPTPQAEEPKSAESVVTVEPTIESVATEESTAESVATEESTAENEVMEEPETTGLPVGEIAPDITLPDGKGNMVSLADELRENEQVVLVFYYSYHCSPCTAQLREIENDRVKYEEKGAQVIAIAVQSEMEADLTRKIMQAQFPIIADSEHTIAEAYDVLEDRGLSTPSVFIINKDRQIVWSEISHIEGSGCGTERVPSQTILENLQ